MWESLSHTHTCMHVHAHAHWNLIHLGRWIHDSRLIFYYWHSIYLISTFETEMTADAYISFTMEQHIYLLDGEEQGAVPTSNCYNASSSSMPTYIGSEVGERETLLLLPDKVTAHMISAGNHLSSWSMFSAPFLSFILVHQDLNKCNFWILNTQIWLNHSWTLSISDPWYQVGFLLTTTVNNTYVLGYSRSIMVPLGWSGGFCGLILAAAISMYANDLLAQLHHVGGKRHIRYRDLAGFIYG